MIDDIKEIKQLRQKIGMTQGQLAKESGVSQSLIAKIESGNLDPSFSNAKKIFYALNKHKKEQKAKDVMNKKIISVKPNTSIKNAIKLMKKFEISQIPVLDKNNSIGIISESLILDSLGKGDKVQDIMGGNPPVVPYDSSVDIVLGLLKHYSLVLVVKNGKLEGVITKSDLVNKLKI